MALATQALPPFDPGLAIGQDAAVLSKNELDLLQTALKATSDYVQGELGEEVVRLSTHFATNSPELPQIVQTIQEISSRSPKAAARGGRRSVSVNTTGTMVLPTAQERTAPSAPGRDDDFRAELERLRAQLEAELRAAREEAERQRLRAEQALEKLEEEAKRADGLMAEMRKKLKTMQSVLQKTGLHKEAEEALDASGLTGFVKGRDVFERLYQDALRRMRVQAENQMRLLGVWDSLGKKLSLISLLVLALFRSPDANMCECVPRSNIRFLYHDLRATKVIRQLLFYTFFSAWPCIRWQQSMPRWNFMVLLSFCHLLCR